MTTADDVRAQQRQTWDRFSGGWEKWDHLVMPMLAPVGEEMIRHLGVGETTHHLDVAAGTGEPGFTIAGMAPRGRVVITDLAPGMLDAARRNVAARGLSNVEVQECSADSLPFADASFDSVSCRFGFMFFPDVSAAVAEFVRVLKPGGRVCASVWADAPGNPWVTIPMRAIGAEVELPAPPPDAPGMFRWAVPGVISSIFEQAGLREVGEANVHSTVPPLPAEEYWEYMTEVAAPVVAGLGMVDAEARGRIRSAVLAQVKGYEVDGIPQLPMHARCIWGTK